MTDSPAVLPLVAAHAAFADLGGEEASALPGDRVPPQGNGPVR